MAKVVTNDSLAMNERIKYERMWELDSYRERSPGERFFQRAYDELKPQWNDTLCDWGIGTGRAANLFVQKGCRVEGTDIAANAAREFTGKVWVGPLWEDIMPKEQQYLFGYCTDVMEHIPPSQVLNCLKIMKKHTLDEIWFSIANFVDHEGDKIGEELHLSVRPAEWWAAGFARAFPHFDFKTEAKHYIVRAFCQRY